MGIHATGGSPTSARVKGNSNPAGMTPTTVYGCSSRRSTLPDRARGATKALLPQFVANHDHLCRARIVLIGGERPSEDRRHAERREQRVRRFLDLDPHRLGTAGQIEHRALVAGNRREGLRAIAVVEELGLRGRRASPRRALGIARAP